MLAMLFLIGTAQAQNSLLTQAQKDEISRRAIAESENDSIYLASVVKRVLDTYRLGEDYKPEVLLSLTRRVFSSDEAEGKAKSLSKFANKIITKGKPASDKEKELWKPCYIYYLSLIYIEEAEKLAAEKKKRAEKLAAEKKKRAEKLAAEKKKREEFLQDSTKRNTWTESHTWNTLVAFCDYDYSIKDSAEIIMQFITDNGLEVRNLWNPSIGYSFLVSNTWNRSILPDHEKILANYYDTFIDMNHYRNKIIYDIRKKTLYRVYRDILKEINYTYGSPSYYQVTEQQDSSVYYPLFLQDVGHVNDLRNTINRALVIDTTYQWQTWMLCNAYEFRKRVREWQNTSVPSYSQTGVIKDTIRPVWNSENMYIINIPYHIENGILVPNGTCSVRQTKPQRKNATGEQFEIYTYDVTMTVNVENGKATSRSIKGYVCQWDENTAAGQGKKSLFERQKAIRAAKPVEKKKISVTKIEEIKNFPMLGGISVDLDNMEIILRYACSNEMWQLLRMNKYDEAWDYLNNPKDQKSLLSQYLLSGRRIFIEMAKRPFMPIDLSE